MKKKSDFRKYITIVVFVAGVLLKSTELGDQDVVKVSADPDFSVIVDEIIAVDEMSTVQEETEDVTQSENALEVSSIDVVIVEETCAEMVESMYSDVSIKLNTQIYDYTRELYNEISPRYINSENCKTGLSSYFNKYYDPLIPLALSVVEMGAHADTRYTWTPVVYSQDIIDALNQGGFVHGEYELERYLNDFNVADVDSGYLYWLGLNDFMTKEGEGNSLNDKTSLGPLQILREGGNMEYVLSTLDGKTGFDLITWHDSMEYFICMQARAFTAEVSWLVNYHVRNKYEFIAMMAVNHNSGIEYMVNQKEDGVVWNWGTSKNVMDYIYKITTTDAINGFCNMVDGWFSTGIEGRLEKGYDFPLCGQSALVDIQEVLDRAGVDIQLDEYSGSELVKKLYPIRAMLNYMSLVRLYESIGISVEDGHE